MSALGIVFGDIGTSPLYTLKTVLALTGGTVSPPVILGSLSLVIWTLILITTVKYVSVAMRVDNDGEGGILALMSLLGLKTTRRPIIIAVGLMGAALMYGDGAITPAISVLSALEGLNIITPFFEPYVLPISVVILIGLFAIQPKGTARIGQAFGPVMALWFLVIGVLGAWGIIQHPSVLLAVNPLCGLDYLFSNGLTGFLVLGGVFLCVTGAEALYADMGSFGAKPIRLAWLLLVFPSLILNYAGQAGLALEGAPTTDNIFYRLCPVPFLVPFVLLATIATIIASQSIITGAFSMTRQAIQLGWLPRLKITQTSAKGYGQIYIGTVNWLLMAVTVGLAIGFRKSDGLASAYGIAVSATMLSTSVLLFIAMREIWNWNLLKAGIVAGLFMIVDAAFFAANLSKIMKGGYIPILVAIIVYGIMYAWHQGTKAIVAQLREEVVPIDAFMAKIEEKKLCRINGTAVFLTRTETDTPPVMIWHVRQNHALHRQIFILRVSMCSIPRVKDSERLLIKALGPGIWRATAFYGFMEHPDIPKLLKKIRNYGCDHDLEDVTYYVGHETTIPREDGKGVPKWIEATFAFMQRNALHIGEYIHLPPDQVVEIGRQIQI